MTLLGKIFTVMIFVMSIVFMSLSLMVFATHKNWKLLATNPDPKGTAELGYKEQLDKKKTEVENLNNQLGRLKDQYAAEQAARTYALASLSTKLSQQEGLLSQQTSELEKLQGAHTEQTAALQTLEINNKRLLEEVATLRENVRVAQNDRDAQFLKVVDLTDKLNGALDLERLLKERNTQLVEQLARVKLVLTKHDLSEFVDVEAIPPAVDGVVLAVSSKDLIEISLGRDDGLKEGHTMEVFRGAQYLGRVMIMKTEPNRAVGKIIPEYKRGPIRKDDRVTTRLG